MQPIEDFIKQETRRQFFSRAGKGLGALALGGLMGGTARASLGGPDFAPKAKRAIYLFMSGAPSQIDLFDYKPKMAEQFDQDLPDTIRMGQRITTMTSGQKRLPVAPSIYNFKQYGPSGAWISDLLPYTAKAAGDLAIIKSMHTEAINHDPAITYIQTGNQIPGRPSLGSWLSYGLGSPNKDLPSFVVLNSSWTGRQEAQALFSRLWGSGFLPSKHQGVLLRSKGDPVLFLKDPPGVHRDDRRAMLDSLNQLNRLHYERLGDPETNARIAQYEMAFRMQASVPDLTDMSGEPESIKTMYGPDVDTPGTFAANCLLARRMAERGVPFVQIFHRGWDQHNNLPKDLPKQCKDIDQACYGLINDLKQRGLLDDTLVVWGGEFGRTIYCQGKLSKENYGRDHHPRCFTMWMAGAGVRGGIVHGDTDDYSYNITRDPVHIHDLNATILHQFGINHLNFTFPYQGLDQRLTGVEPARVVNEVLA